MEKTAQKWRNKLSDEDYKFSVIDWPSYFRFIFFRTFFLRKIIRFAKKNNVKTIFDFGSGGGKDTVPLAHIGFKVTALDCSEMMVNNLMSYKKSVENFSGKRLRITALTGDFLDMDFKGRQYDLVFSNGVLEHFLNRKVRKEVISKLLDLTKPGGTVITGVPNGKHPYRRRFKQEKLGGYDVPEIDYDEKKLIKEFRMGEVNSVKIEGFNVFGYWLSIPEFSKYSFLIKPVYFCMRLIEMLIPNPIKLKKGLWLVCVVKKN